MRKLLLSVLICLPLIGYNQRKDAAVVIGKVDTLYSKVLKERRPYWIYVPETNSNNLSHADRYPVVYLLDGNAHFHSVSGIVQILSSGINGTYLIPEMIVVGIPNTDRTRDLTPTHSDTFADGKVMPGFKTSGGGTAFLKFIKEELIRHIDSTYNTSPYRVFVGHSIGGLAVINALYTMPDIFSGYLVIDPSLWWGNHVLVKPAKDFFQNDGLDGKSLFLAQANTLSVDNAATIKHFEPIKEFARLLETGNGSGLRFKYQFYENDSHGSVAMIATYEGLRYIFNNYNTRFKISMTPGKLKEHFQQFSEETRVSFTPPEAIINSLGNEALSGEKNDQALQYFQLGCELYPQSSNAYLNLAEAWTRKGDVIKAIESCESSLKINPQNTAAKAKLKKLRDQLSQKK